MLFTKSLMWQKQKWEFISVSAPSNIKLTLVGSRMKRFPMFKIYLSKVWILNQHSFTVFDSSDSWCNELVFCVVLYVFNKLISPVGIFKRFLYIFLFSVSPIKAVLSEDMSCSCERCTNDAHYHWYYKNGSSWARYEHSGQGPMKPEEGGTYACRAVWRNKRSLLSNTFVCEFLFMDFNISPLTYK